MSKPATFLCMERYYNGVIRYCTNISRLKQLHSILTTSNLITQSIHLGAKIIIKYSNFNDIKTSKSLFNYINNNNEHNNSFIWNTMLRAYCNGYYNLQTLELYYNMRKIGIKPNNYSFPFVLKACAKGFYDNMGMLVHCDVMKTGFDSDLCVAAGLVHFYGKCGLVIESRKVFDEMSQRDLVCWTTMVTAYERAGMGCEGLRVFWNMRQEGFLMDGVVAISVASAIGQLGYGRNAKVIHGCVVCNGCVRDVSVGSAILAMYGKCGEVENACLVFDRMVEKDETTWNAMLSCYTKNGLASEAFALFDKMLDSGIRPGYVTFLVMVGACAWVGSKKHGKKFHDFIVKSRIKIDFTLGNALMDMYAKCGDMETCIELFNERPASDWSVSIWNVLISGYGMHGHGRKSLEMLSRMIAEGIQPDHITFTSILSACSHSGLIDEARRCFADMKKFSVNPEPKHYACLVDMLGRAGLLSEAYKLIKEMGSDANDEVWGALLLACTIHGNKEFGEIAAENLFRLEPKHAGYRVSMSNLYADSSKWKEVVKLREAMKIGGLKKSAATSLVEFPDEVCSEICSEIVCISSTTKTIDTTVNSSTTKTMTKYASRSARHPKTAGT